MLRTLFKTSLLMFCSVLLWCKADSAMATTCELSSALKSVTLSQNYTLPSNTNGATDFGNLAASTFWSGNASETYTCPDSIKALFFCGADGQYIAGGATTVLGPGVTGGGYVSDGSGTTGAYGGCHGVSTSGSFPSSSTLPSSLNNWKYVGAKVVISDSAQARNITLQNKLIGAAFLTTSDDDGQKISGDPLTLIYLSGTITIPASCTLSSSSTITLPDTYSGEFGKAGTGGKVGNGTRQPMSIKCSGGSESATIDLHVSTSKVSGDDMVSSNPDVGVRVLDSNGNTVSASNGKVSATLSQGEVDVPFTYVPVSITGKNPTPGDYSAIETLSVTIP